MVLNNEETLNSLDLDMIRAFRQQIDHWEQHGYPKILLLTSNPTSKAFSSGGDIKNLYYKKVSGSTKSGDFTQFFKEEYELDYLIAQLKKKNVITIAVWNGIVMGGGVGISMNC